MVRKLKSDTDSVQVNGFRIRWSKRQQRYTIYDIRRKNQVYDTEYFDSAVAFARRG